MIIRVENLEELFNSRVDKTTHPNGCWIWTGCRNKYGYGSFITPTSNLAHRYSYQIFKGEIPKGFVVMHTCDNPPCVNPDHLKAGTHADNVADKCRKKRHHYSHMTHCKRGHEFTEENTRINKNGYRVCRACNYISGNEYYKNKLSTKARPGLSYVVIATDRAKKQRIEVSQAMLKDKALETAKNLKNELHHKYKNFGIAVYPYISQSKYKVKP